jgi:hypothetical protein
MAGMMACRLGRRDTFLENTRSGEFYVGTLECQSKIPHPGDFLSGTFGDFFPAIDNSPVGC